MAHISNPPPPPPGSSASSAKMSATYTAYLFLFGKLHLHWYSLIMVTACRQHKHIIVACINYLQATHYNAPPFCCMSGGSLLAEALFLVFTDGRKETSAMDRKWLYRACSGGLATEPSRDVCSTRPFTQCGLNK